VIVLAATVVGYVVYRSSVHVPASAITALNRKVSAAYPGWTIEHDYVGGSPGGLIFYQDAQVAVVLRWTGSEDLRLRLVFDYGERGSRPSWSDVEPDLLRNQRDAASFVRDFKARHPRPGGVVALAYGQHGLVDVAYWDQQEFTASNGGLSIPPHSETWHAVRTGNLVVWQLGR